MKWLLGALMFLLLGAMFQLGLLVYAMYTLLAVILASRYLARKWIMNLEASRAPVAEALEIDDEVEVSVSVRNNGRLRVPWLLIEDSLPLDALTQIPPRIRATGHRLGLVQLRSKGEMSLNYQVRFLMRGYFQIGPLLIESGDLFGLHRRYRIATEPRFVLVRPKVVPFEAYELASRQPIGEVRMTHRLFEDPSRHCGVRPYEMGDPLNRIHWRATARTGCLQSKAYEPSSVAGATILLDFHRDSFRGRGEAVRSELAITSAASLANALQVMGQRVGLITNGRDAADRIREEGWRHEFRTRTIAKASLGMRERSDRLRPIVIETRRGPEQFDRILETLARLEWTDGLAFSQLVIETASRLPRNATVVAVLPEVTPEIAVSLIHLRQRGYAVTAMLVVFDEPKAPDWAQRPDWAGWLLAGGIDVKRVANEAELATACGEIYTRA